MIRSLSILLVAALALAGCKQQVETPEITPDPAPILYQVNDAGGKPRAWLFGTIHALPDGTNWRTETLRGAITRADTLVVEIANLDDNQALARTFVAYATTPGQPDIAERVPKEQRPALFDLIGQSTYRASDFADIETWAAALMLSPTDDAGESKNGADRALVRDFAGREVVELEGAERQFAIFDALAERDQIDLLLGVIKESETRKENPDRLRRAWLIGDATTLENAMEDGILADPELRAALLVKRNRDWAQQIDVLLKAGKRPLVAVGTAHLLGPDGLAALLEANGYSLERIQ
ncbi:MAG: TraB/GumN family protein [Alphaproteobacteria bacterium]|nr:MAG: TraB/GumN family protein [Alphaproteobacteria bacterium]